MTSVVGRYLFCVELSTIDNAGPVMSDKPRWQYELSRSDVFVPEFLDAPARMRLGWGQRPARWLQRDWAPAAQMAGSSVHFDRR